MTIKVNVNVVNVNVIIGKRDQPEQLPRWKRSMQNCFWVVSMFAGLVGLVEFLLTRVIG